MSRPATPTQADVLAWVRSRFGPDRATPERRALKLGEEAGEVLGAVTRLDEDRGSKANVAVELAQVVLCAMAVAESVGVELVAAVRDEWRVLQTREWDGFAPSSSAATTPTPTPATDGQPR